jgi:NAD-dependent deacetylase
MSNAPLVLDDDARLLVLTGAGVSAESGVPTFRGMNGLWEGHRVEDVASPQAFLRDPLLVWKFYSMRRGGLEAIKPNPAHHALAAIEKRLGDRFLLVTQNVDGLHRVAGNERRIDLHGDLMRSKCSVCDRPPFEDRTAYREGVAPMCGRCKEAGRDGLLRPDIVWFGEMIDPEHLRRIDRFVRDAGPKLVFMAVGTSGQVYPAAALVDAAAMVGGQTWLVNADPPANMNSFDHVRLGAAGEILPGLLCV